MTSSLDQDFALLKSAVREGGALSLEYFRKGAKNWEKKPGDPVSEADLAVDALLKKKLHGARPDYGWLSEETVDDKTRLDHETVWIVDPIDGTRSFIKGRPEFTVCAALVQSGRPLAGVVFNPATDEFFEAMVGGGAYLNGERISVRAKDNLENAHFFSSKKVFDYHQWYDRAPRPHFGHVNSIAYRIVLIAMGKYDISLSLTPKSDWDIAAADIILSEAGGTSTLSDGAAISYNNANVRHRNVISTSNQLHPLVMDMTASL